MSMVGVFLGGEGKNELGSRDGHPSYQSDEVPGVLQTLLTRAKDTGWQIVGAINWSKILKFRGTGRSLDEERNVLGLVEAADAANAQVVAFFRDSDDDVDRAEAIKQGIEKAREIYPNIEIIGGAAIPVLEAWILAMLGHRRTETLSKTAAQTRLVEKGIREKDTAAMVKVASEFKLDDLPDDAKSLNEWLKNAKESLPLAIVRRTHEE